MSAQHPLPELPRDISAYKTCALLTLFWSGGGQSFIKWSVSGPVFKGLLAVVLCLYHRALVGYFLVCTLLILHHIGQHLFAITVTSELSFTFGMAWGWMGLFVPLHDAACKAFFVAPHRCSVLSCNILLMALVWNILNIDIFQLFFFVFCGQDLSLAVLLLWNYWCSHKHHSWVVMALNVLLFDFGFCRVQLALHHSILLF